MGKITLSAGALATLLLVVTLGAIPFCAMGFLRGAFATSGAAPAFGNLVYLPGMWLSGIFMLLPEAMRPWVVIWPAFHLDQAALGLAGVTKFSFMNPLTSIAVLAGVTILCGGLALRRVTRLG